MIPDSSTNLLSLNILIVDDHRLLLNGTIELVRDRFPDAQILSAQTVQDAFVQAKAQALDLVIVDLSLPETTETTAHVEHGLGLLKHLMQTYPTLNLMVQSSNVKALIRLMPDMDAHQGGLTIADKSLSIDATLMRMEWAMQGLTHTKDLQTDLEVKPEWLEVLRLAFEEGLQDKAIAQTMHKSERMIRHYWSKIQDVLAIYPEEGKNVRALTQIRARETGLLD
ncbi:response regulator [Leptolyngbya sp. GGD]|uniref:response regulator n=1 Tax=Leptolyngbya sp. GGD TaxID=2997907 RepID=UPI00227ABEEE|nr:response regulator transcription factor [Leptolyngbya sp. GGD]MCY6490379.1 response regulator transcription factor [Leptolyngbya sp. GGD]